MAKGAPGDMSFAGGGPPPMAMPPVDIAPPPPPPQPPPPPVQMQPTIPSGPVKVNPDSFAFMRSDPRYVDLRQPGAAPLNPVDVNQVILHDYGAANANPANFSPYHISVDPSGRIYERYDHNQRAPHAYRSNPQAYGLSYADRVGATPTPEAMDSLRFVARGLRDQNPNLEFPSHGEAYNRTRGTPTQASRQGRGLDEASWRTGLFDQQPQVATAPQAPPGPAPMANRSLVAAAGLAPPQAPPAAPPTRVASSAPMVPQAPAPRIIPTSDPSALTRFPRAMPGRPPNNQLWNNQNPTQRWDTLNRTFDMPQQPPDGMDHYSQMGMLPAGTQARPDPVLTPRPPGAAPPSTSPMIEAAGKRGGQEPWKPNWNAGLRMMSAVRPPQAQGLLPQAGIPPPPMPQPRAPWQAARGMARFKSAFPTA